MNRFLKMILPAIGFSLSFGSALADPHTNAVLSTTFTLTAYVQESVDTNSGVSTVSTRRFGNADIVNAVATDLGLQTNDFTAVSLIFLDEDVLTNQHLSFVLRSISGADFDTSTNLQLSIPQQYEIVTAIMPAPFGRATNSTDMTIFQFVLNTTNVSFDIQGFATLNSSSITLGGRVLDKHAFTSDLTVSVAGSGKIEGKDAVFKGTFRGSKRRIEIQQQ